MRYVPLLTILLTNAFSLTTEDLVGSWKAEGLEGPGSISELWYAADGSRELRSTAIYNDMDYKLDVLGTWSLKSESIVEKTNGGWIYSDGSLDSIQPDPSSSTSKAVIVAGSPRKLQITDCDSPTLCVTHEYTFVAATKEFTQSSLADYPTSIRRWGRAALRIPGSGRSGLRFFIGNRMFDVTGRLLGPR